MQVELELAQLARERGDLSNQLSIMARKKEGLNEELMRIRQRLEQANETNSRINRNLEDLVKDCEEKQVSQLEKINLCHLNFSCYLTINNNHFYCFLNISYTAFRSIMTKYLNYNKIKNIVQVSSLDLNILLTLKPQL